MESSESSSQQQPSEYHPESPTDEDEEWGVDEEADFVPRSISLKKNSDANEEDWDAEIIKESDSILPLSPDVRPNPFSTSTFFTSTDAKHEPIITRLLRSDSSDARSRAPSDSVLLDDISPCPLLSPDSDTTAKKATALQENTEDPPETSLSLLTLSSRSRGASLPTAGALGTSPSAHTHSADCLARGSTRRFFRSHSIDRGAKLIGMNVRYLERLDLPLLRSEAYAFFQEMHYRFLTVREILQKNPLASYTVMHEGLHRNLENSKGDVEIERALKKVVEELNTVKQLALDEHGELQEFDTTITSHMSALPFVRERLQRISTQCSLMERYMRGFQDRGDAGSPKDVDALEALPTTKSNAEGNRCMMDILLALDSLCLSEGLDQMSKTRLLLAFQRLSSTFLEKHDLEEPCWRKDA